MSTPSKAKRYKDLLKRFQKFEFPDSDLKNPFEFNTTFNSFNVINPWEIWHGNLDAEIMFIGQDFSNVKYFKGIFAKEVNWTHDKTEIRLRKLFKELGVGDIGLPETEQTEQNLKLPLFFTNAVLGIKDGRKSKKIKPEWYRATAPFLKKLIDIIQPRYLICMGDIAYKTIHHIYHPKTSTLPIKKAIEANGKHKLPIKSKLFVVAHCSPLGLRNRSASLQGQDWKKLNKFISA